MDLAQLKAEIARKKEETAAKVLKQPGKSYFRRGDLLQAEDEAYLKEKQTKEAEKLAKLQAEFQNKDTSVQTELQQLESAAPAIPEAEVHRRLKDRGEPIMLFGESLDDKRRRLRLLELATDAAQDPRSRNEFMDAMEHVDEQIVNEMMENQANAESGIEPEKKTRLTDKYTMESLTVLVTQLHQGDTDKDQSTVRKFIKFLLELWKDDLDHRSDAGKQSTEGKVASATYKQTELYLKPLLRQLKEKSMSHDILTFLCDILKQLTRREYIKASDAYYRMAIGNAPWPIGVTNVGIHNRTGREKISAQHIAHVLNDEVQRKYIQGLKRLMTYCQKRFPTDPSKCLEYQAIQGVLYGEEKRS